MTNLFAECSLLSKLPDISEWDIKKVTKHENMFDGCSSLSSLPNKFLI